MFFPIQTTAIPFEVVCSKCGTRYDFHKISYCPHCHHTGTTLSELWTKLEVGGMMKEKNALDVQEGGNHYKKYKIQPTEYCQANKIPWCESNVIKYVTRHRDKNGLEDLKKARHYIDLLIQLEYGDEK